jgi:hypothetical protein
MTIGTDELARRQNEALANMMGADSRRIDSLVGDVGTIKGEVTGIRSDVSRVGAGVDELRGAMTVLSKHQVTMEGLVTDIRATRDAQYAMDARMRLMEVQIPPLVEARTWAVRGILMVLGVVGLAVLGLVVFKGGVGIGGMMR